MNSLREFMKAAARPTVNPGAPSGTSVEKPKGGMNVIAALRPVFSGRPRLLEHFGVMFDRAAVKQAEGGHLGDQFDLNHFPSRPRISSAWRRPAPSCDSAAASALRPTTAAASG